MADDLKRKVSGLEFSKNSLGEWEWGADELIRQIATHIGSVIIDQIAGSVRVTLDLKTSSLTVWPFGIDDNLTIEFDLAALFQEELDQHMYGPNTFRKFAETLRKIAAAADDQAANSMLADDSDDEEEE